MERRITQEKIVDKMRELRDKRDRQIIEAQSSKDMNFQENLSEEKVLNVKYLGQIEEIGDVYLVIEQQEKEGNYIQIERYENEKGEVIGGNNKADNYDFVLLSEKYRDRKELLELLQQLDKNGILDLNEIEQGRLEELARVLGIKVEDLEKVAEINPEEEITTEDEKETEKEEQGEVLSQEELEKVPAKTEIDVNQKVTDKETMSSLLKVQSKGYKRLEAVYSDRLKENGNSTRFALVGIKEVERGDGTKKEVAEKIDTLDQRYGNNPTKGINGLNRDGTEIQEKQVQSIYQIKGDNENQVAINIGQMGTIEVSYVRTPRQNNGEAISIPIETHSIRPTIREVRQFMNKQRNSDVSEEAKRLEQHQELGCETIDMKDINDSPYDDTHTHIEIDDNYLNKLVDRIIENDEIASVYNRQDVKNKLLEVIEERGELPESDGLVQQVETEMEKEAQREHELQGRNY